VATDSPPAFFSYCRADSEFALQLAGDLKAAGANVWLDQLDIEPGTPWDREVEKAMADCPRLLVILSPTSVNSDNVRDEVSFALSKQKRVIPVLCHECDIPFRLARLQYIDFTTDYSGGLKILLKTLGVEQFTVAGSGAAASAVLRESRMGVLDLAEQARAAEQARLEQERKQAAERERLEREEHERETAATKARLEQEERERLAAAEQARLQEERRLSAAKAQLEEQERERKAAEEKARLFLSKKMMIGLGGGAVVLLLVWILWPGGSNNQPSQPQTAVQQPQSTQQYPQTTEPQPQTAGQHPQTTEPQPQSTGRKPKPPTADVKKPVAKNCPEGVYCDPDTNLMWTMEDNGKDITWQGADQYCRSLTLAGLSGWELPTIDELAKLYDPQSSNVYKIRGPFRLTACCPSSSTKDGSGSAWYFGFRDVRRYGGTMALSYELRALCVRPSGE
jgi:TIR domain/Protein of unknown function (DUF1566)